MALVRDPALVAFCEHFGIRPERPGLDLLEVLGRAFARLPYENLTKLIRRHRCSGPARRRQPHEVIAEHIALGTGGTCFALARLFATVLDGLGFRCHPVLCEMQRRADSHCALLVELDDGPCLLDPGYLIHRPIALPRQGEVVTEQDGPGAVRLAVAASNSGARYELHSGGRLRYCFDPRPVVPDRFLATWDRSFDWTMMNDVHVCAAWSPGAREAAGGYAYVHGNKLRQQGRDHGKTINIRGRQREVLSDRFGIAAEVVEQAYEIVAVLRRDGQETVAAGRARGSR